MLQRQADGLARGGVPEPCRASLAPGEERLTVGAERHRLPPHSDARRADRWDDAWRRPRVAPFVRAACEDRLAVGTIRDGHDLAPMREGRSDGLAGGDVPEPRRPVDARR